MEKLNTLANLTKNSLAVMKKHSPEVLTIIGIVGMISTTIIAVRATPKALVLIDERKDELGADKITKKEAFKAAWACYIPSAVVGTASILCLIASNVTSLRRNTALKAAYTLSSSTLKEYREKVVESIGEKKEKDIRERVSKEKIMQNPVREVILTERGGDTICYDAISGRYFKSDRDTINRVINELNRRMRDEMSISLNEFYYELGLDCTKLGDYLGWNIDKGYIDIDFSSHLDSKGTPCLVIDYQVAPVYDYT